MISVVCILFQLVDIFVPKVTYLQERKGEGKKDKDDTLHTKMGKELGFVKLTTRQTVITAVLIDILRFVSVCSSFSIHLSTCICLTTNIVI